MKKLLTLAITALFVTACNAKPNTAETKVQKNQKIAVAYFSATGTTKRAAENLAKAAQADLYEIKPLAPYTNADLNWTDKNSRCTVEMNDKNARPALTAEPFAAEKYDTVFLGFPIWWGTAPRVISTFLEKYDFSNKRIILFATSGGSGLGNTDKDLKPSVAPSAKIIKGKVLNGNPSVDELKAWVNSLN